MDETIKQQADAVLEEARSAFKRGEVDKALGCFRDFDDAEVSRQFKDSFVKMMNEPANLAAYERFRQSAQDEYKNISSATETVTVSAPDSIGIRMPKNEAELYGTNTGQLWEAARRGIPMAQHDIGVMAMNTGNLEVAQEQYANVLKNEHATEAQKKICAYYGEQIENWETTPLQGVSIAEARKRDGMASKEVAEYATEHPALKEAALRTLADRGYPGAQKQYADMMDRRDSMAAKQVASEYRKRAKENPYTPKREGILAKIARSVRKNADRAAIWGTIALAGVGYLCGALNKPANEASTIERGIQSAAQFVKQEVSSAKETTQKGLRDVLRGFSQQDRQTADSQTWSQERMDRELEQIERGLERGITPETYKGPKTDADISLTGFLKARKGAKGASKTGPLKDLKPGQIYSTIDGSIRNKGGR